MVFGVFVNKCEVNCEYSTENEEDTMDRGVFTGDRFVLRALSCFILTNDWSTEFVVGLTEMTACNAK